MPPGINAAQLYVGIGAIGGRETVAEIMRVSSVADKVDGTTASLTVEAETRGAGQMLDEIQNRAKLLDQSDPEISVTAAGNGASAVIDDLKQKTKVLDQSDPKITISADGKQANMVMDGLLAKAKNLSASKLQGGMGIMQGMQSGGGFGGAMNMGLGVASMGGGAAAAVGGVAAGSALLAIGSIMKAGEMEKYQTQLEVFLGSADKAKERIAELTQFAAQTPFELPQVVQASRTLQVFAGDVLSTGDGLRMIGDVAAGTQNDFQEVAMWFGRMYDAMKSGRPFGEATMRLQEMGAISGQDREKIEALAKGVKDGTITMSQAWDETSGSFSRFSGMMMKQSGTLEGKLSNFGDAIGQGLASIGEKMLPFAKAFMDIAIPAVTIFANAIGFLIDVIGFILTPFARMVDAGNQLLAWLDSMGVIQWVNDQIAALGKGIGVVADFIGSLTGKKAEVVQTGDAMQDSFDRATGAAQGLVNAGKKASSALDGVDDKAADAAKSTDVLADKANDARTAFGQMRDIIRGAAKTLADQKYGHEELTLGIEKTNLELRTNKDKLKDLEAIKDPTRAQRLDIIDTKLAINDGKQSLIEMKGELQATGKVSLNTTVGWVDRLKGDLSEAGDNAHYLRMQLLGIPGAGAVVGAMAGEKKDQKIHKPGEGSASGGYIDKPGWVGEHGKEWFDPGKGGYIANDRDIASAAMASNRGAAEGMGTGAGGNTIQLSLSFPSLVPYSPAEQEHIAQIIGPTLVPYMESRGFRRS